MCAGCVARLLIAIPHPWLADTITSLLQALPAEVVSLYPADLAPKPLPAADLLVVDPFSFERAGLECFQAWRQKLSIPVVVLLPADTADYRAAAQNLGADAMVLAENANPELLHIVQRLLGEAARHRHSARRAQPGGEYHDPTR